MNIKFDKFKKTSYKRKIDYKMNENDFPDLSLNIKSTNKNSCLENSFASAILTDAKIGTKIEDKLKPGWISIEYDIYSKKKYSYGDKTESMIQRENQSILEETFNYRIDQMIDTMTENHVKHFQYYENIYEDDETYKDKYFYNKNIDTDEEI